MNYLDTRNTFFKQIYKRGYSINFLTECDKRIQYKKRDEYLKTKEKKDNNLIIFSTTFEPTALSFGVKEIIQKHWDTLGNLSSHFRPMIAWKKGRSLKDLLVKARFAPKS